MSRDTFDIFAPRERGRFGDNELRDDNQVTRSNLCDLDFYLRNDNPDKKAIAVSLQADTPYPQWVWLPRSVIEYVRTGSVRNVVTIKVTLPEHVAKEKGLI